MGAGGGMAAAEAALAAGDGCAAGFLPSPAASLLGCGEGGAGGLVEGGPTEIWGTPPSRTGSEALMRELGAALCFCWSLLAGVLAGLAGELLAALARSS